MEHGSGSTNASSPSGDRGVDRGSGTPLPPPPPASPARKRFTQPVEERPWWHLSPGRAGVLVAFLAVRMLIYASSQEPPMSAPVAGASTPTGSTTGFVLTEETTGWVTYSSRSDGFSVSLPTGWVVPDDASSDTGTFFALDASALRELERTGVRPQVFVSRDSSETLKAKLFYTVLRGSLLLDERTIGDVRMTTVPLPAGRFHVLHAVQRSSAGPIDLTIYGLVRGDWEYELIFVTPERGARSHYDDFRAMASRFAFTG
jgi:hypothetical protein